MRLVWREGGCWMNPATACWLHFVNVGLQTSQAQKERSVSIILVPKCSGVSLASVLRQGINPEGSPLLQPLLMHFAWVSESLDKSRNTVWKRNRDWMLFYGCVAKPDYSSWFWVPCPSWWKKGPIPASTLVSYWENGTMGPIATSGQGGTVHLGMLCKTREGRVVQTLGWQTASPSAVSQGPIWGFVPPVFEALQTIRKPWRYAQQRGWVIHKSWITWDPGVVRKSRTRKSSCPLPSCWYTLN